MGILGRLGNVVKSYLNDEDLGSIFKYDSSSKSGHSKSAGYTRHGDPDLNAAYEELNDFLGGEKTGSQKSTSQGTKDEAKGNSRPFSHMPEELRKDFDELGVKYDSTAAECKAAYKKILKAYHPDHHAGNAEAVRIATEKTAKVNAAYTRIEKWLKTKNG
ncbi:MAG: J domain-containing protein [Treponema sp.]|nr:J domain-containing protein [Treponema sp.]